MRSGDDREGGEWSIGTDRDGGIGKAMQKANDKANWVKMRAPRAKMRARGWIWGGSLT